MHEVAGVHPPEALNELDPHTQHGLQAELFLAKVKQLLQVRPKDAHDQNVIVSLDSVPVTLGEAGCADYGCEDLLPP